MSKTIALSIPFRTHEFSYQFPRKCVYCGKLPETQLPINVSASKTFQQSHRVNVTKSYNTNFLIPYCFEHAKLSKQNNRVLIIASVVGGLLAAIAGGSKITITNTATGEPASGFLVAILALLGLGPTGGAISYFLSKYLLAPFYQTLRDQFGWSQHSGALGININFKIEAYSGSVLFYFSNDQVAEEFSQLNSGSKYV